MNRPTLPEEIPQYIADGLNRQDSDALHAIAAYAEELAEYQEAKVKAELEEDEEIVREESYEDPDRPDDVPGKACVTIKEINDNKYYYYQWRDGSRIKSKYKAPVSPSE
ncbi:hypothetical protein [Halostagnicola kamekurae]|uniref:DUF6788 domain-containing protein n=1 Tax=Halostagnicola kamekurae TaxID=619731 RepID=A0A1I6UWM2_9EURY|nr:hypothetical protein [Halostagnicola kamekurae]SFT05717.1 hypothetical protein SAMN04488556_4145 [Halostagnicola kamekurae]